MFVIGITGLARSGKDTVAGYISKKYGFQMLVLSRDTLDPELRKRGLPVTKETEAMLGDELRQKYGRDVLSRRILEKAKTDKIVVVGFRTPEEAEYIKNRVDKFHLIEVFAPKEIRVERKSKEDFKDFFKRDSLDIKRKGLARVLEMTTLKINNDSTLQELHKRVDRVMGKLL
jgi:dephospho-CoA kinase